MAAPAKPKGLPPAPKPSSRAALERRRKGFVARGPSGEWYRLRALSFERHAFAGGMPPSLATVMGGGEEGVESRIADLLVELGKPDPTPEEKAASDKVIQYLDRCVLASIVEPEVGPDDLPDPADLSAESLLPGEDWMWLVTVALRATEHDAEGRKLFGFEPTMIAQTFRIYHECPDDC